MNISRIVRTIIYLKPVQIYNQILCRLNRKSQIVKYDIQSPPTKLSFSVWIDKSSSNERDCFTFLNIVSEFVSWGRTVEGNLWAYNLNYMDWLNQKDMTIDEGSRWIDNFIDEIKSNKIGLDPYPIALRGINWIKFISKNIDSIPVEKKEKWNNSLYSQYKLLVKKLEYHLLGNHILEDAFSLFIASLYFRDELFYRKSVNLLKKELSRQLLPDGAHFEQSPMYHCILLDRLLDCCNFSVNNEIFRGQREVTEFLNNNAVKMLGHLNNIIFQDKKIPLLNDSAYKIAPSSEDLFQYAERLNINYKSIPLKECGYRFLRNSEFEVIVDVGNITASYQPGHSHADTFNFELKIQGIPFIIDTGISTYEKNARRQYERSTAAHNTVTIADRDSSEVWGGFRVGNRAKIVQFRESDSQILAKHDGFGKKHYHERKFTLEEKYFEITDYIPERDKGISYLHFSPNINVKSISNELIDTNLGVIEVIGAERIEIIEDYSSDQYNRLHPIKVAKIHFSGILRYIIRKK